MMMTREEKMKDGRSERSFFMFRTGNTTDTSLTYQHASLSHHQLVWSQQLRIDPFHCSVCCLLLVAVFACVVLSQLVVS